MAKIRVDEKDSINKLDDDIIRRIIDLLPTKDASRTSVLSTRWKNLWRCISIIELRYICSTYRVNASSFLDIIDSILSHHDASDIKRFVVSYSTSLDHPKRIHHWICEVIKHNVQELHVNVSYTCKPFILPSCLFKSESLIAFEIDMGPSDRSAILGSESLLFSVHLPSLLRLKLSRVYFLNDHSVQHFFSNIPKLQQLCISECSWENITRLNIDIPTMEILDVHIDDWDDFDCLVTVAAPSLITFRCRTNFTIDFLLSKHSLSLNVSLLIHSFKAEKRLALFRLLESFKQLMALHLTWEFIEVINYVGIAANSLPIFINLKHLEISANNRAKKMNLGAGRLMVLCPITMYLVVL